MVLMDMEIDIRQTIIDGYASSQYMKDAADGRLAALMGADGNTSWHASLINYEDAEYIIEHSEGAIRRPDIKIFGG